MAETAKSTAAAPAYNEGQNAPLSQTLDGRLRVDASVTTTSESTAEATAAAPSYTEGQDAPLSQDRAGNLRTRTDDGKDVAQGATTDAPVGDNTTVASAAAATGISLFKRLVNLGIAILAKINAANASTTAATITQAVKTVAATGTPEALGSGLVESVAIRPNKARGTANTGNVYVGFGSTNDTQQLWELTPTASPITLTAPAGKKIDLASIFIDVATNGDGVVYFAVN